LLYTGSSNPELQDDNARRNFSCLEESAADWIVNHKVKRVGIDSLSIENYGFEGVAHKSCWRTYYRRIESTVEKFCGRKDLLSMPVFVA
jgi:kynurenine formamidase